jgi:hypothetical protein
VRDYLWQQLAAILQGRQEHPALAAVSAADRAATLDILRATQPDFAAYLDPQ